MAGTDPSGCGDVTPTAAQMSAAVSSVKRFFEQEGRPKIPAVEAYTLAHEMLIAALSAKE
jgi:hypothetical protein